MSHVHMGHKIPWQDLIECCRIPDPSALFLPIGECSMIHIIDKATKIKVQNRSSYIKEDKICNSDNCQTVGMKFFSKGKLIPPSLYLKSRHKSFQIDVKKKAVYFSEKLLKAIIELAETEERKKPSNQKMLLNGNLELHKENICANFPSVLRSCSTNDQIVLALFLECDINNLLHLENSGKISISEAFHTLYGGQAVGNGYTFLMHYHIIPFYLIANAIIAAGYQNNSSKWGLLNNESYFYQSFQSDCDFLTFIPSLRPYIAKDIFMIDLEKTDELLKKLFKYIYIYILLYKKVHKCNNDDLLELLQGCIGSTFKLYYCFSDYCFLR